MKNACDKLRDTLENRRSYKGRNYENLLNVLYCDKVRDTLVGIGIGISIYRYRCMYI